ncbi:MAG TPA: transposase [Pyrinomonadaceae bacterium]|nr:transposase [Pyrinomonadaceae bacterium]
MSYDPLRHHRRSIRLRGYDYSQANPYYLTLCAEDGQCLFGEIVEGRMHLNSAGKMIEKWWTELEQKFPNTLTDSFQIMPNHLHSVFVILGDGLDMAALYGIGLDRLDFDHAEENEGIVASFGASRRSSKIMRSLSDKVSSVGETKRKNPQLGEMMQWFKTMATNEYIRGVRNLGWEPFPGKLWQRNYFEHVVRRQESLTRVREYIRDNPARWHLDRENRDRTGDDEFDLWLDEMVESDSL